MITMIRKMMAVTNRDDYGYNHRNQILDHCNQLTTKNTRGQSIAEYGILISVVLVALLAMQVYMKRGIQAAVKYSADQFGNQQDYEEADSESDSSSYSTTTSLTEGGARFKQQSTGYGVETTMETSENTITSGSVNFWSTTEE